MRKWILSSAVVLVTSTAWTAAETPTTHVKAPMVCSRGPDGQTFQARVTLPTTATQGSTYAVRIESFPSATISSTGLNYLHGMLTDYLLPAGVSYVPESAHVVADTGTANVNAGARAWAEQGFVRLLLTGHAENGSSYTPPSLEFQVKVTAPAGSSLPIRFVRHRVEANVFLIGDVSVVCTPQGGPLALGATTVTAP